MIADPFADLHGADAYELLGVPVDATTPTVQRAYRRRMKTTHPDICRSDASPDEARLLNLARDILTHHRAAYDAYRREAASAAAPTEPSVRNHADHDPWTDTPAGPPRSSNGPPGPQGVRFHEVDPQHIRVHPPAAQPEPGRPSPKRTRTWPIAAIVVPACVAAMAIWFALAAVLNEPPPTPAVAVPKNLAGTWTGEMMYHRPADHLRIHVRLHPGKQVGHIDYDAAASDLIPVRRTRRVLTLKADVRRLDGTLAPGSIRITRHRHSRISLSFHVPGTEHQLAKAKLKRTFAREAVRESGSKSKTVQTLLVLPDQRKIELSRP